MAALAELTDTISVAADAISTNFELQQLRTSPRTSRPSSTRLRLAASGPGAADVLRNKFFEPHSAEQRFVVTVRASHRPALP